MTATLHVIFGPSGAGKSTYAKTLARSEPAVHFSIDDWMARLFAPDMPEPVEFEWMMERVERCEARSGRRWRRSWRPGFPPCWTSA
ncbi:ATP-binding protein [Phenylobacterium aquaticum]|nr:AAA family ATPase [Phenylobacterium aquaticum]MCI3132314.1 ATP-binding protein [Phenylobacterium aquaticum]